MGFNALVELGKVVQRLVDFSESEANLVYIVTLGHPELHSKTLSHKKQQNSDRPAWWCRPFFDPPLRK